MALAFLSALPCVARAQDPDPAQPGGTPATSTEDTESYVPITPWQRLDWTLGGVYSPRSLGVGVVAAGWQTAFDTPREWGGSWPGFGKRYLAREADVAISNALEAGLGSLWGEDPRYIPSHRRGVGPRLRYAAKTVFLAPRPDGTLAPAWGRYAGNTLNNVIENAWLPPSITTPRQTLLRSADGFVGRLLGNLYEEFWPDVQRWMRRRR